jgi:hypothetical protein
LVQETAVNAKTTGGKGAARLSRNQIQNSRNAETQRDVEKRREKEASANLCASALSLRSLRANQDIAVQRDAQNGDANSFELTHPAGEGASLSKSLRLCVGSQVSAPGGEAAATARE